MPPAARTARAEHSSSPRRRAGRARCSSTISRVRSGSTTACRSSSADAAGTAAPAGAPDPDAPAPAAPAAIAARSAARSARPSARSEVGSAPPIGLVSNVWAACAVSSSGELSTQRRASSSGATAPSRAGGSSSPATSTGTPPATSIRRSNSIDRAALRTRTAIRSHGVPFSRCSRRSRSAMPSAWAPAVVYVCASTRSATGGPAATRSRWARRYSAGRPVAGMRRATSRLTASATGPSRRQRRRVTTSARRPSAWGKRAGNSSRPRTSAPRNP